MDGTYFSETETNKLLKAELKSFSNSVEIPDVTRESLFYLKINLRLEGSVRLASTAVARGLLVSKAVVVMCAVETCRGRQRLYGPSSRHYTTPNFVQIEFLSSCYMYILKASDNADQAYTFALLRCYVMSTGSLRTVGQRIPWL